MHIVMVETTKPRGFDHIEELVEAGVEVSFLTSRLADHARSQGFERHKLAARVLEIPGLRDAEHPADLVRGRLGPHPPDGVLCTVDDYLLTAARLARELGLRHESEATVRLLRDKAAVRRRLTEEGIGTLRWQVADTVDGGLRAAADIGYPVVVKPPSGHGSVDVTVVWEEKQARGVLETFLGGGRGSRLLVEEYVTGRHVSAEMLVQDGRPALLGFAERLPCKPGTTVERGGHFPARFEQSGACRRFAYDVARALGVRDSALHVELAVTPHGPELIEVNGRVAGHVVPRQMGRALDRSIACDLASLAAGRPLAPIDEPVTVVALRQVCSDRSGRVQAVEVPAGLHDRLLDCHLTARPGDQVVPTRHNYQRLGHVLAEGVTEEEATATADEAVENIRITLDGDHGDHGDRTRGNGTDGGSTTHQPPAEGTVGPLGEHVVLLLDGDGPPPERVIDTLGAATGRVSVLWCGEHPPSGLEARWARRYEGRWYHTPDAGTARRALRALHALHPVAALVTFSPHLGDLRDRLRAGTGSETEDPCPSAPEEAEPPGGPGHTVLSVVSGGVVRHLDIVDDLGSDEDGHRTLRCPSLLRPTTQEALREAARRAIAASDITEGVVRCRFATVAGTEVDDGRDGPGVVAPTAVRTGIDEATCAVYDAAHTRDLMSVATAAALGNAGRCVVRRRGTAVFRGLAAPEGAFRVVQATAPATLHDLPEVVQVRAPLVAGSVSAGDGNAFRLCYTVLDRDADSCQAVVTRIESALVFRHEPLDRTHVVVIDRTGAATWTRDDGEPVLPPERFRVSVLSADRSVTGPGSSPVDVAVHTDVFDHEATAGTVRALHRAHPVDRIVAVSERLLAPAAELRSQLGLVGDSRRFVRSMLDKAQMKRIARRAGIRHAEGGVLHEPEFAHDLLDAYGAIVVKPRDLSGSQGVAVCTDREQLRRWLRSSFVPGRYLVERRVAGPMCHIDAVVHHGLVAWDVSVYRRDTLAYTRGQPLSSRTVDDPALRSRAEALLQSVTGAWRVEAGVLHLEAFVEDGELVFCEVAARPGGAGVIQAFRATRGLDLRHAKVLIDAGEDPRSLLTEPVAAHAGYTVHYSSGGRLLHYDDSAVADRAFHRTLSVQVGESLSASAFSGTGLSAHVFAEDSSAEIDRLLDAAEKDVRIRMEADRRTTGKGHTS